MKNNVRFPRPPLNSYGWLAALGPEPMPQLMQDGNPWPKISVITPSYNQAEYLEATIRSILLQGYPNLEYIIIDGGSTDGSVEIIKKYEPWLAYWQSQPDGGQYAAIQIGFEHSTGEIMAWLNSDDLYFPWTLKTVGEVFSKFQKMNWLSTSQIAETYEKHNTYSFSFINGYSRYWFFSDRKNLGKSKGFIQQESTFWRRQLWEKAGSSLNISLKFAGDFELWARFYEVENLVTIIVPLGIFRHHQLQKTISINNYLSEVFHVISKYPKPYKLPKYAWRLLLFLLRKFDPNANLVKDWFGRRGENIRFDMKQGEWLLFSYWA